MSADWLFAAPSATRLAEAADRAAKAEARAEKAEAFHDSMVEVKENWRREAHRCAARVTAVEAKLDEARGVLRSLEYCNTRWDGDGEEINACPACTATQGHASWCHIAAVIAPETGKEDAP